LENYPQVSLKKARSARDAAKLEKDTGSDPILARQARRIQEVASQGETFEHVARERYKSRAGGWSSHHQIRELRNLEKDLFPWIGARLSCWQRFGVSKRAALWMSRTGFYPRQGRCSRMV
jgi:hypothetical protein